MGAVVMAVEIPLMNSENSHQTLNIRNPQDKCVNVKCDNELVKHHYDNVFILQYDY